MTCLQRTIALGLSVGLVTTQCASLPITGAASSGEHLEVLERSETHNVTSKVKVGELTHRDRAGRKTGSSDIVENRTRAVTTYSWTLMQGSHRVDEADFYRIGGDLTRSALVEEQRRGAQTMQALGVGSIIAGAAIAIAGAVLCYVPLQTVNDPDTGMPTQTSILPGFLGYIIIGVGGGGGIGLGSYLIGAGAEKLAPDTHLLPREDAEAVADAYNATLGIGPAPTPAAPTPVVAPPSAPVQAPAAPQATPEQVSRISFTLARTTFKVGESIVLTFSQELAAPQGQQYWVTLVKPEEPDATYGNWHYVPARAKTDTLSAPSVGEYEIRLHDTYPQHTAKVLHRTKVYVK